MHVNKSWLLELPDWIWHVSIYSFIRWVTATQKGFKNQLSFYCFKKCFYCPNKFWWRDRRPVIITFEPSEFRESKRFHVFPDTGICNRFTSALVSSKYMLSRLWIIPISNILFLTLWEYIYMIIGTPKHNQFICLNDSWVYIFQKVSSMQYFRPSIKR